MRDNRRILVVGAGLSGMVLATALKRAGTAVDIVEVHPRWQVLGVGISVQGPALREVIAAATHEAGVEVRFGRTVNGLKEEGGRVEVEFSDGAQGSYDLVVGADGAGSKLRELLFGAAHRPQYTGQAVWRAMVPKPPEVTARHAYYGPRHKAGFNPVSREEMYIYLVQNVQGNPRLEPERWPAVMRELLADFGGTIAAVRECITDPARIVYRPIGALILPSPWYRGRVLLIGDAAHTAPPHLASGATIAIEDLDDESLQHFSLEG